jgi:hypothetical protein
MRSDPRIGLAVSLIVAGAAALWLLGQWLAFEPLWSVFGTGSHAITLFSIFLLIAGVAAALVFARYAAVKADLLSGRNVIARWQVDAAEFAAFRPGAEARDKAEKRSALFLIWFFLVAIFGAFAIFDAEAAPYMLAVGGASGLAVTVAYLAGSRVRRNHLTMRSGEVIVGSQGLLFNGVLHVWGVFLSRLGDAILIERPRPVLTITYGFLTRVGWQYVAVPLPVPANQLGSAAEVVRRLGRGRRRQDRGRNSPAGTGLRSKRSAKPSAG